MPYVVCTRCGTRTYSAARHSTLDQCPRCDRPLARSPGIGAREARQGEKTPTFMRTPVRVAP
jgi:hypothetical protein